MTEQPLDIPESCVLFATADWDEPYWTNKQHCAKSLSELGIKVLYIESVGLRTPKAGSKRDWQRLKDRFFKGVKSLVFGASERSTGIYVLSPLVVPAAHKNFFLRSLNRYLLRFMIARSVWGRGFCSPIIWTYHPFMLDVLGGRLSGPLLYHCVDDLAAVPGVNATVFRLAEAQLLRRADVVFATASSLAEHCSKLNPNTHFLPNVVDLEHFGQALLPGPLPADLEIIPEPRLGYHGVLSDFKIDFRLLLEAARLKPEWQWVFIGEEREGQKSQFIAELAVLPNVHFLGYRSYQLLPAYLRGFSIGLLPSKINDYTRGMFPMKFYEYLGSGLRVVSTPLDFTKKELPALEIAQDLGGFIRAINIQLGKGKLGQAEVEKAIGSNTWQARIRSMLRIVSLSNCVAWKNT